MLYASEYLAIATVAISTLAVGTLIISDLLSRAFGAMIERLRRDANHPLAPVTATLSLANLKEYERLRLSHAAVGLTVWDWDIDTGSIESGSLADEDYPANLQTWLNSVHPSDFTEFERTLKQHLLGEIPIFEATYRLVDHTSEHWVQTRGRIIARCDRGTPTRMVGTHQHLPHIRARWKVA